MATVSPSKSPSQHPDSGEKARQRLTEEAVRSMHFPKQGEERIYDLTQASLLLRVRPGSKAWYCFKWMNGRQHNIHLGDFPGMPVVLARKAAAKQLAALYDGKDPAAEKRAKRAEERGGKVPLRDVLDHLVTRMTEKGRQDKHIAERKRIGEALIAAGLRDLCDPRACAIAEKWINDQTCSSLTKHRYGQHVKALGRVAVRRSPDLPKDPFMALEVGSPTIPAPAMFALPELFTLASDRALRSEWGRLFAFLLYTGCRYREGAYARWSRIDLDSATFFVLPPSAEEREAGEAVKRNKGRTVTLQPELVELLKSWPKSHGDFVFGPVCQSITGATTVAFREHLDHLVIPIDERHIHTLRHSHVALSVASGVSDLQLRLSVGHGGPEMTKHYANAAMLWRAKLKDWKGTFRLRDAAEARRLAPSPARRPTAPVALSG